MKNTSTTSKTRSTTNVENVNVSASANELDASKKHLSDEEETLTFGQAEKTAGIMRAVDHKLRFNIIKLLGKNKKELSVGEISTKMKLSPAATSQHLSIMKDAAILNSTKDGRVVYYSLNSKFYTMFTRLVGKILSAQNAFASNVSKVISRDESDPININKSDIRKRYKEWENGKVIKGIIQKLLPSLPKELVDVKNPIGECKRIIKMMKNNIGLFFDMTHEDVERSVKAVLSDDKKEISYLKGKFADKTYTVFEVAPVEAATIKQHTKPSVRKNIENMLKEQNSNLSVDDLKIATGKILKSVRALRQTAVA